MARASARCRQWGVAWVVLAGAVALHVADESLTGFLPFWNAFAASVRSDLPWAPLPTFTFSAWLGGLIALVVLLLALTPFALRGKSWLRPISYFLSVLMVFNGLAHIAASLVLGAFAPGAYSSFVLAPAAVWLFLATWRSRIGGRGIGAA